MMGSSCKGFVLNLIGAVCFFALLAVGAPIYGQDLNDESTDLEEIKAESEAVGSILKTTTRKLDRKRSENARKFRDVRSRRDAAAKKRDQMMEKLKKSEEELLALENEGTNIQKEMEQIASDTEMLRKDLAEQQGKIEEARKQKAELQAQREESRKRLKELQKEQAKLMREVGSAQDRAVLFEHESQQIIQREQEAVADLEKTKAGYVAEKVQLDQKVASIKKQIKKLKTRKAVLLREIAAARNSSYRLREEVRVGNQRVNQLQESIDNQVMYDEAQDQ